MLFKRIVSSAFILAVILFMAQLALADFTAPGKNISNTPTVDSKHPKIAHIPGTGDVYVIWVETDGTNDYLYFSKSKDYAATWTTPFQLTLTGQILEQFDLDDDDAYAMVVSDPYIHIVFQWRVNSSDDFDIVYMRSSDLGETAENWDVWLPLTNNASASRSPDLAADGEYVHVAYLDNWPFDGERTLMYKRITDYGSGTVDLTRRLKFSASDASGPKIAVGNEGQCVHIVYDDYYSGHLNIFYKHIEDSGAGAYQTRQLTFEATELNCRADIAVGSGTYEQYVYITYETRWPGNFETMYKRLDNYGHTPCNTYTARLTYSTQASLSPYIDFDTGYGNVHVTYYDYWTGNADIMHRILAGGGGDGFVGKRVSWGTGDSSHPSIAASGQWAYVAWHDNTSGNYEIYVKFGN